MPNYRNMPVKKMILYGFPSKWYQEQPKFDSDRKQNGACQGLGGGKSGELLLNQLKFYKMITVVERDGGDGCPALQMC